MGHVKPKHYAVRTPWGLIQRLTFSFEGLRVDFTQSHLYAARMMDREDAEKLAKVVNGKVIQWRQPKPEEIQQALAEDQEQPLP